MALDASDVDSGGAANRDRRRHSGWETKWSSADHAAKPHPVTPHLPTPSQSLGQGIDLVVVAPGESKKLGRETFEPRCTLGKPDRAAGEQIRLRNQASTLVSFRLIYQATFPAMRLARDTDREIVTTMRGKRHTTSIEGTLTGLGGNLVIIDDPLKQDDAHSEAVRKRTIEWYRSTLPQGPLQTV